MIYIYYHSIFEQISFFGGDALVLGTLKELRGHKALTDDGAYNILVASADMRNYISEIGDRFKRSMSGFITCEAVMLRDHVTFDISFDYNLVSTTNRKRINSTYLMSTLC